MATGKKTTEEIDREREVQKRAVRGAVLLAVPKGRFMGADRVEAAVNEHLPWNEQIPYGIVSAVLRDAAAEGVLLHEQRPRRVGRGDYYAHPTPKLRRTAEAAALRKERIEAARLARDAAQRAFEDAIIALFGVERDEHGDLPPGWYLSHDTMRIPTDSIIARFDDYAEVSKRRAALRTAREEHLALVNQQ